MDIKPTTSLWLMFYQTEQRFGSVGFLKHDAIQNVYRLKMNTDPARPHPFVVHSTKMYRAQIVLDWIVIIPSNQ